MAILELPDVPDGVNPFILYRAAVRAVLLPVPSPGFEARLYVLFALAGYTVVVSLAYLVATFIDYRRRGKPLWVWRLVRRSNGTYLVGAQHVLFTIFAAIASLIIIGYLNNSRRTLILHIYMERAYFWRSLVWLPMFVHGWISSWSNLQAAILSSQRAAQTHLLSPRLANSLYVGVLVGIIIVVVVLDVYSAWSWVHFWRQVLVLRDILVAGQANYELDGLADVADLEAVASQMLKVNDDLDFFTKTQVAVSSIYVVASAAIVAINLAGLGLLMTLRRQISFNSRRFSTDVRSASKTGMSSIGAHGETTLPSPTRGSFSTDQITLPPPVTASDRRGSVATFDRRGSVPPSDRRDSVAFSDRRSSISPSERRGSGPPSSERRGSGTPSERRSSVASATNGLMRKVFFAGADNIEEGDEGEEEKKEVIAEPSRSQLKEAAVDQTPTAVALSQQAKQLLALKKVEWDLIVFVIACTSLATLFMAMSIWLAAGITSVYSNWASIETALFLVPWAYLVCMAVATSFLFYNLLYHLAAPKTVSSVGVRGQRGRNSTESGLTDERERSMGGGRKSVSIIPVAAADETEMETRAPIKFATSFPKPAKAAK
ncbi:hypothetical protein BCR35DRAFT_48611 [Leucosporidium creatinivorum]|uniref:Uncharacterized protein n=1 Tax=Leucosporidium creatinivorum TaxID=106004 RepID=A0A1Y2FRP8_9BASI|nr:hypothetical protein BCR35DRAFT_48611 [Leucosporidium creatinivorum]